MHPTHLILSPGTRIVTRNETNPIGGGAPIPGGAVGAIIDSPADAYHAYKVRLNDGREAMLRRAEFSILTAIALETGRAKDYAQILQFIESGALDADKLDEILKRHGLVEKWERFGDKFLKGDS